MHNARVAFTPKSEADILEIIAYLDSFGASSQRFRRVLAAAVKQLETYPDMANRRRDLTRRDVYFWLVNPYWLILRKEDDLLIVVSVLHCSRKPGPILHERLKSAE